MIFTCTQENLSKGLSAISRVGDKKTSLAILNNVLLQARKDGVVLTATNLELAIKTKVRGKIEEEGEFTVQARLLSDFVHSLKKENITVSLDDKNLVIKGENHQTTIRGLEASDFPVIPEVGAEVTATLPAKKLQEALTQTVFAMSPDDTRPELNGGFLKFSNVECTIAATDSYRLSEKKIPITQGTGGERSVILPARTMNEALRILSVDDAAEVTVRINDTQILFAFGETEIVSRIVAGKYPEYQHIIPKEFQHTIEFSVAEMEQAIKTTSLFCKQGINDIRITTDERFDDISLQAENSTFGKNVSHVKSSGARQQIDIVFNYKFLIDGLLHLNSDIAVLHTNDATTAAMLTAKKDKSFIYIIMPIRQ